LKRAGTAIVYLSMNGGFDDDLYEVLDQMRCAEKKRRALANLSAENVFTSVGMIVVRGVNEREVAVLADDLRGRRNVRELHLRSVGEIGRHMETRPLTLDELAAVPRRPGDAASSSSVNGRVSMWRPISPTPPQMELPDVAPATQVIGEDGHLALVDAADDDHPDRREDVLGRKVRQRPTLLLRAAHLVEHFVEIVVESAVHREVDDRGSRALQFPDIGALRQLQTVGQQDRMVAERPDSPIRAGRSSRIVGSAPTSRT